MKISFETIEIRELCRDNDVAISKLGIDVAVQLQNRLADLFSVKSPLELMVGNPKRVNNNSLSYSVDLSEEWVMIFSASNLHLPKKDDDSLDWSLVSRIKIDQITKKE